MSGIVWLALDGVGHPKDAPPGSAWEQELPALRPLIEAGLPLDATLGVPGLPQSGTGQSCWLTGQDAVRRMGRGGAGEHFGPYPGPTLQALLREASLPVRLKRGGGSAALLNFYPPGYFAAHARRPRHGCFPYAFLAAGLTLNPPGLPSVAPTLGLGYAAPWPATLGLDEVQRSGEAVARAAGGHDLLVLDLWLSDLLGHQGRPDAPLELLSAGRRYLRHLDALLAGLLGAGARVAISSDHGNFENLGVKSHTLARVPFAGSGVDLGRPGNIAEAGAVMAGWFGLG
ncbi:metalloenzyme domain protein [Deinococcus irradiatisoli]|uniref:Metalloenzyme domain protein n=1 Tax=Deinococcus irradiatisoli TaxID=2202254 RepID=A0A2Z3JGM4_9DEIO|nr:metalloenzyme domain protein [Deinococcus irradiatisoli]AWN24142.1 metalloenzyme domain protein [Deinococcus irradiatisoli]